MELRPPRREFHGENGPLFVIYTKLSLPKGWNLLQRWVNLLPPPRVVIRIQLVGRDGVKNLMPVVTCSGQLLRTRVSCGKSGDPSLYVLLFFVLLTTLWVIIYSYIFHVSLLSINTLGLDIHYFLLIRYLRYSSIEM